VRPLARRFWRKDGSHVERFLRFFSLTQRYIEEKVSDQVQTLLSSASALALAVICVPEIVSALCRRRRERKLSTEEYRNATASLFTDTDDVTVIGITEEVIAQAVSLIGA